MNFMPSSCEISTARETRLTCRTYLSVVPRLLCIALMACGIATGQEAYTLEAIEIVGAENYSEDSIIAASGLQVGTPVTPADFERAIARINATGVFDTLEFQYVPQGRGYKVIFTLHELEQLYSLEFQGFDDTPEDLWALLKQEIPVFAQRVPATGPMIDRIGDTLQARWRSQGHESEIAGRLEEVRQGELVMLFRPEERLQTISYVGFENSKVISGFDLQGFFNRIARGEPYSDARLKELLHYNVRPLYEEQGHMGVEFCPCRVEDDPDNLGLRVTVQVDEGEPYYYDDVPLPDIDGFDSDKIRRMYAPVMGDVVNLKQARDSQAAIEEALRANGFIRARTQLDVATDHDAKTVGLELLIERGYLYTFDRLHIEGLNILSEPVIRKRWGMASGDPYVPTYPGFFLDRLQQEGAFEGLHDTQWKEDVDETTKRVNVTLRFIGETKKRLYPASNSDPISDPF